MFKNLILLIFSQIVSINSFAQKEIRIDLKDTIFYSERSIIDFPIFDLDSNVLEYRGKLWKLHLPKQKQKNSLGIVVIRRRFNDNYKSGIPLLGLFYNYKSANPEAFIDLNQNLDFSDDSLLFKISDNQWIIKAVPEKKCIENRHILTLNKALKNDLGKVINKPRRHIHFRLGDFPFFTTFQNNYKSPLYNYTESRIFNKNYIFKTDWVDIGKEINKYDGKIYYAAKPKGYTPQDHWTDYISCDVICYTEDDTLFKELKSDTLQMINKTFKINEVDKYGKWLKLQYLPADTTDIFKVSETIPGFELRGINISNNNTANLITENKYTLLTIWNSKDYYGMYYSMAKADSTDFSAHGVKVIGLHYGEVDGYEKAMKVYNFKWKNYNCPAELFGKIDPINYPSYTLLDNTGKILLLDVELEKIFDFFGIE